MLSIGFWQHEEYQYDQNVEEYDHIDMPCCLKTLLSFIPGMTFFRESRNSWLMQVILHSDHQMQSPIGVWLCCFLFLD